MINIPGAVTDPSRVEGKEIHFESGNDNIPGYLATPSHADSHRGIVVIHQAIGLVDHIRDIARGFANVAYNALAPDLYSRAGRPTDPSDINSGHAFLADYRPSYREKPAFDLWADTTAFFSKHLT